MARRITSQPVFTPAAVADTTAFTTLQAFAFYQGGTATQQTYFWEISISGMALTSSSPTPMVFARNSTAATGAITLGNAASDTYVTPATAALGTPVSVGTTVATTYPQRDAAARLQNCGLNAFGGVYFWRGNRVEECMSIVGSSADTGSVSLSCHNTGATAGAISGHVIYETL